MIRSMTGYGRAVLTAGNREYTVEIRSVNNRYLDCNVKLPRALSFAEDTVKQAVKAAVSRGKVDVFVSTAAGEDAQTRITLNRPVVEEYLKAMEELCRDYPVENDISASVLAKLPDVFLVDKPQEDEEALTAALRQTMSQALEAYTKMRETEGEAMERDLRSRRETILNLVGQVEQGSSETVREYQARLEAKMREVLESTSIDESRILTEAAIFADKVAVDEETVRLRSHLNQMDAMLTAGGAVGRKLDFLLQEMNREANTIGSKCSDVRLARIVVEIKAELEKIREQVQNIE